MSAPIPDRTVDVVVVGLGVAGEAVAGELASAGLEVLGVESRLVGGECPYWGVHPQQDDDPSGRAARGDPPRRWPCG
jgi:choline dehydrogenase-like flavoprotein